MIELLLFFTGAGFSIPAGFVNWPELAQEIFHIFYMTN
jgi:hypothetical protein